MTDKPQGFKSRKFILACVALVVAVCLRIADLIVGGECVNLILGTVGAYILGNVAEGYRG